MKEQRSGDAIASLTDAVAVQDELVNHRFALEWAQMVFGRLLRTWMKLQGYESLAYEDKVAFQVQVLDEATSSLNDLQETLTHYKLFLTGHQRQLGQMDDMFGL